MKRREFVEIGASAMCYDSFCQSLTSYQNKRTHWTSYRGGNNRNGIASINAPGKPTGIRWKIGGSTERTRYAAVVDRTAYFDLGTRVIAVEIGSRNVVWSHDAGERTRTPAVDSTSVYFGTEGGTILALNRETGQKEWKRIIGSDLGPAAVSEKYVYFGGFGNEAEIICLNKDSGNARWRYGFYVNYPIYDEPAVALGDESLYFAADEKLVRIERESGELVWEADNSARFGPVHYKKKLYFSGRPSCYDRVSGNVEWSRISGISGGKHPIATTEYLLNIGEDYVEAFNRKSGNAEWDFTLRDPGDASVVGNTVYVASAGTLYALNITTGVARWEYEFSTEDPVDAHGLIPLSDGFIVNYNDTFYMLESEPAEQLTTTDVPVQTNDPSDTLVQSAVADTGSEGTGPIIDFNWRNPGPIEIISGFGSAAGGLFTYLIWKRNKSNDKK